MRHHPHPALAGTHHRPHTRPTFTIKLFTVEHRLDRYIQSRQPAQTVRKARARPSRTASRRLPLSSSLRSGTGDGAREARCHHRLAATVLVFFRARIHRQSPPRLRSTRIVLLGPLVARFPEDIIFPTVILLCQTRSFAVYDKRSKATGKLTTRRSCPPRGLITLIIWRRALMNSPPFAILDWPPT